MKKLLVVISIGFVLIFAAWVDSQPPVKSERRVSYGTVNRSAERQGEHVILHAAPGNTMVQMFATLRNGFGVDVTTFPDGWGCTKVGDLTRFDGMSFYKLDCGTRVGYVNVKWVD